MPILFCPQFSLTLVIISTNISHFLFTGPERSRVLDRALPGGSFLILLGFGILAVLLEATKTMEFLRDQGHLPALGHFLEPLETSLSSYNPSPTLLSQDLISSQSDQRGVSGRPLVANN